MNKKIKVFYDGKCSICKKEINFYSKIDKDKIFDWVNIHRNEKKITHIVISRYPVFRFRKYSGLGLSGNRS